MGIISSKNFVYRGIPQELVLAIRNRFQITDFIETGTYMGDTSKWAAKYFDRVITFEASSEVYSELQQNKLPANCEAIFGDSSKLIQNYINGDSIYYLDAHYSSGNTFNSYPLLNEIKEINAKGFNDFIIIDDARFVLSKWNNERYCTLTELLCELSKKDRYSIVFDDMIISVPSFSKDLIDDYTNKKSNVYWKIFLAGEPLSLVDKLKKIVPSRIKKIVKKRIN
jgi:hypothetical protein